MKFWGGGGTQPGGMGGNPRELPLYSTWGDGEKSQGATSVYNYI